MRPQFAHRHNTAFARSSSLGEVHAQPVIQKVTVQRGNGAKHLIVKNGVINKQKFGYRKYDKITFEARLIGAGYFYATTEHGGAQHLIFATPATSSVKIPIELQIPIKGLNFHIAPAIPTNLKTTYIDPTTRFILKSNPASYTSLGFVPTEPEVREYGGRDLEDLKAKISVLKRLNPALASVYEKKIEELEAKSAAGNTWDQWGGDARTHSWKYGRSGSDITRGQEVKWQPNYDGSWLGASAMYRFTDKGWECVQQNIAVLQVGQPHCIVGQLVGYVDTYGIGGEYHPYTDSGEHPWNSAESIRGDRIRIMEHGFRNEYGEDSSQYFNKRRFDIQAYDAYYDGGKVPMNFKGGYHFPVSAESDKYCAKVEWWNPDTNTWSSPQIHPDFTAKLSGTGKFAFHFRFPRQLQESDDYYDITPQWQLDKTWDAYPRIDTDSGSSTFKGVIYSRIGRPNVDGTNSGIQLITSRVVWREKWLNVRHS